MRLCRFSTTRTEGIAPATATSMAAYAALASLSQTTDLYKNQAKYSLSIDADENIRSIHEYVIFLLSFLHDFPQRSSRWEAKMRDLAHETEDIIEQFMWQQSFYRRTKLSRVKLEDQLRNVTGRFGVITGDLMDERPAYSPVSISSSSVAAAGNNAVIGLDEDLSIMKDLLCANSSKLRAIPIFGMGGIGKTTLARSVYDDSLIVEYFHIRVWITVSLEYSSHKILLGLLDAMNLTVEGDDDLTMTKKIYQHLIGRRYLIVLDDVWDTKVLDDVRHIFPDDGYGSRILLTTRQMDVATYPHCVGSVHEMKFMNDSQSWDLLRQKVFGNTDCPSELEEVGKEIARRCAGLPLAVVLVAGILSSLDKTRDYWEEVAKNVNPIVDREIKEILSLSYTYLPHHLRPCFLLIGGFQEDANISASRLIRLWVGEGFLKHKNGCNKSLEEEASEYLEDLVKRNLVIVTDWKSNGKIKSCSLHDMVRALCIMKAHQEKFIHVIDRNDLPQGLYGCELPRGMVNERRISLSRSHIDKILGSTIRSILWFQFQNIPNLLRCHKLVRVLDALGVDLKEIPSEVFDLYHLRYLSLMGPLSVPSDISNLVNLQTLIIHQSSGKLRARYNFGETPFLPWGVWRLPQLRHLLFYAPYQITHPVIGLDLPLENLQTLSLIANLVLNESIVQMIPNVKRLGLTYTNNHDYDLHHLNDLHRLEKLEVIGYLAFSWQWQHPIFPRTLKKLTLVGGGFPWKDMTIVGSLPNLQVLKLLDHSCNGTTWETCDGDFRQLKFLLIDESLLQKWITHSKHFPILKCLVLRSCRYLREILEGIGEIATLELIEIDSCTKSLVESVKKIKEDQESYGNDGLQVRISYEEIQSIYQGMDPSPSRSSTTGNDPVIGLVDDKMAIKKQLCGHSSKLQVISIVGTAGIGKTTLASSVYYDPLILEHFVVRVWLTVSRNYVPNKSGKILLGLVDSTELLEGQEENDKSKMTTKIYPYMKGRRYLLVIDNVGDREVWDGLKDIFPDDGNGSRIMLTTRLADVAADNDSNSLTHEMQFMSDSQSWDLLKQKVFGNTDCPSELEGDGREIARRCGGLPLAVVLFAGFLTVKHPYCFQVALEVHSCKLEGILSLCYQMLPRRMQLCLVYMEIFSKGKNIHASNLIKTWVAKGSLKHRNGCNKSSEEEGEEHLEDLVKRNLVTVISRKSNGKIKSCSLHDLVRKILYRTWSIDLFDSRPLELLRKKCFPSPPCDCYVE